MDQPYDLHNLNMSQNCDWDKVEFPPFEKLWTHQLNLTKWHVLIFTAALKYEANSFSFVVEFTVDYNKSSKYKIDVSVTHSHCNGLTALLMSQETGGSDVTCL